MKYVGLKYLIASSILIGCGGSSDDPKTASRDEFTPPSGAVSMTDSGKLEIRFASQNAEDELQGYHVFGYQGSIEELKSKLPSSLKNTDLYSASLERCKGTNTLFAEFGIEGSEHDCKSFEFTEESSNILGDSMQLLQDENARRNGEVEDKPADKPMTGFLHCAEGSSIAGKATTGTSDISLKLPEAGMNAFGTNVCIVESLADNSLITNGKTYTFFVVAVAKSDKSSVSYTSNFVEDTPRPVLFKGDITVESNKKVFLPLEKLTAFGALKDSDFAASACSPDVCLVTKTNTQTSDGLYFGRLGTAATNNDFYYPQRIFFSTPSTGDIEVNLRGNLVNDPLREGEVADTIPGDEASDSDGYSKGSLQAINEQDVFDMKFTKDGKTHYGKLVIRAINYENGKEDQDKAEGKITVSITLLVQTAANVRHYFW